MHRLISFNRQIRSDRNADLPVLSSAALYGRGIFTTLAVSRGKPFLWDLHEKRLRENAAQIKLDLSEISFELVHNDLLELIKANQLETGRARLTLFDSRSSAFWQTDSTRTIDVLITTAERREKTKNNFKLTISPFRVNSASPLVGVKSCNYLENILALEAANANGFDEAVRINERAEIVSATMANIFWIKDNQILTPALSTGALGGTTRERLLSLIKENNLAIVETKSLLEDLQNADEIFLTSAGLGVCSVKSLDSKILERKLTFKIQTDFAGFLSNF